MQRSVVLIFGQTGSGKTYAAARGYAACPRAIVAECGFGEFPGIAFGDFNELVLYLERIGAFQNKSVPFRVSYTPRLFEQHLIFLLAQELGNCWLFLEEADRFDDPRTCYEYDEIITRGRHYGVSLCAVGLHPYLLPIDLRRQATKIISFRQTEPNDIKWIGERVGDLAFELAELPGPPAAPPHPFLLWDASAGSRIVRPPDVPSLL